MKKLLLALIVLMLFTLVGCKKEVEHAVDVEVIDVTNIRYDCSYMGGCKFSSTIVYEYNGQEYTIYSNHSADAKVGDIITVYVLEDIYVEGE